MARASRYGWCQSKPNFVDRFHCRQRYGLGRILGLWYALCQEILHFQIEVKREAFKVPFLVDSQISLTKYIQALFS